MMTLAVAALIAGSACAQERGQGQPRRGMMSLAPPPLQLLSQKSVQDELKLTEDQVSSAGDLFRNQMRKMQSLQEKEPEEREKLRAEMAKDSDEAIKKMLKPDQAKRLNQIHLQLQGAQAFDKPELVKDLNINEEQKTKIKDLREAADKQMRGDRPQAGGDRQAARQKMQEINKATGEKIVSTVFNDEQKAKWKELTGEPFKGEIRTQGGRPGGGGGNP
jgi:hypothetical protein